MVKNFINLSNENLEQIISKVLQLDRSIRLAIQIFIDTLCIFIIFASTLFLTLETFSFMFQPNFFLNYVLILVSTLLVFYKIGLYNTFVRYVSIEISILVAVGSLASGFFVILTKLFFATYIPSSMPIIYWSFLFISITATRFIFRTLFILYKDRPYQNIALYGAGNFGFQVLQLLSSSTKYRVKVIIDDNPLIQGRKLYKNTVMSFEEGINKLKEFNIDLIIIAISEIDTVVKQNIISKLKILNIKIKIIPPINNLIENSPKHIEFKDIMIEDLLGRNHIKPLPELMNKNIHGQVVLVTGAGGSIGKELCNQILKINPKILLFLDISELAIYKTMSELELQAKKLGVVLIPLIGSVQDRFFITNALKKFKVNTIYHAAAYKHVPLMEQNQLQAIKNNSLGTLVIAEEAIRNKITSFTLISTDKAVNPTNIMGASKRLAELICINKNSVQKVTRFSIVRFGNVLGSSGSVIPLFKKQISSGGPITLTHPEITRYFMTVKEAVELVIQSSSLAMGGEIFLLDMGPPIKIKDLAFNMVQLLGLRPYFEGNSFEDKGDIAIKLIGLRPGEKMYEELSHSDNLIKTIHPRIMKASEDRIIKINIKKLIDELNELFKEDDHESLIKILKKLTHYVLSKKI